MQLAPHTRHFKQKTLLVTVDSEHVKGYEAIHDQAHTAFVVESKPDESTQEKQHIPTGDSHTVEHNTKRVIKLGAAELEKHAAEVTEIFLFVPAHLKNEFQDALSAPVRAKVTHVIEADVTHESPIELAARLVL